MIASCAIAVAGSSDGDSERQPAEVHQPMNL
jgi:hypothetical protein